MLYITWDVLYLSISDSSCPDEEGSSRGNFAKLPKKKRKNNKCPEETSGFFFPTYVVIEKSMNVVKE